MSLISSRFGIDSEGLMNYFGGIGRAILGNGRGKFNLRNPFNNISQVPLRQSLVDVSFGELMSVAQNVPHLNTIISKKAEMFSNMIVRHVDKDGNDIENSEILKLLGNPNPLQSWEEFLYEYSILDSIYSNNFIYKNQSAFDKVPRLLWCLPSGAITVNLTGKIYRQSSLDGIIENYKLSFDQEAFKPEEIIQISEGIRPNGIVATSRIHALQMPLSNIVASLKSLNIITTERGQIGFVTQDSSGSTNENTKPFDAQERKIVEKDYRDRQGLDGEQGHVSFSSAPLKWIPMTFDVQQLMLYEGQEDSFGILCDKYGMHRQVFADSFVHTKSLSTGQDIDAGTKYTYQNTLQPQGQKLLNNIAKRCGGVDLDKGERLICEFDLPCMRDDELKEAQAELAETQKRAILFDKNIINGQSWADMEEVQLTGTGVKDEPKPAFGGGFNK